AKPEVGIQFGAGGASSIEALEAEGTRDVGYAIELAKRHLDAGAAMIMIESEGITEQVREWRTDVVARIASELGLERVMFEAAEAGRDGGPERRRPRRQVDCAAGRCGKAREELPLVLPEADRLAAGRGGKPHRERALRVRPSFCQRLDNSAADGNADDEARIDRADLWRRHGDRVRRAGAEMDVHHSAPQPLARHVRS